MSERDRWAEWLLERRFGGDPELKREFLEQLGRTRDKVLDNAKLREGETLLDVGCGDGLIAFGALERGAGNVLFADVSHDLLQESRRIATELGVLDRCRFLDAPAEDLSPIGDDPLDVVTTRSVLIFVGDKRRAFREFFRVLRPGGRISLFEPINRFARTDGDTFAGYDLSPLGGRIGERLRAVYEAIQPPDSDPMLDFDERDLIRYAQDAGFFPVSLALEATVEPSRPRRWETFLHQSGNPRIPSPGDAMEQALTAGERERLTAHLRPLVEQGRGTWRIASAYLWAVKS